MCHLLLLSPVFGILVFWFLPLWIAGPVYAVILLLSVLLYVATVRMMRLPQITGVHALLRRSGVVIDIEGGKPRVRIGGEIWQARGTEPLRMGDTITVVGQDGLTLEVERTP